MRKHRLSNAEFIAVLRAALFRKVKTDGDCEPTDEEFAKTLEVLASKNKSEC
jgi:hypothetical protein